MLISFFYVAIILSLIILYFYYVFFFFKLFKHKNKNIKNKFNSPVSIIICAKNEYNNLKSNLPLILNQVDVDFEVVVVDDQSSDSTKILLQNFANEYNNLSVVTIENHINKTKGKKFALTLGIKSASHEYLLLTDADCVPSSNKWLYGMTQHFNSSNIILGYGSYRRKKSFLNKLIRFDTFNVAIQYFSFSLNKLTYMGVGRNLAYKRSLFFNNKGFATHIHIPSGDDDLFIQQIANKDNVEIEVNNQYHTISEPIISWKKWFYQKRRHISTSSEYKFKFKFLLSLYPLVQLIFWILFFILVSNELSLFIVLIIFFKLIPTYYLYYDIMKKLSVFDLYFLHPIYEVLFLLIQVKFVILNFISQPKKWSYDE